MIPRKVPGKATKNGYPHQPPTSEQSAEATHDSFGGYALMEMKSKAEALDYATKFMDLHRQHWPEFEGECEVRPLEDHQM